MSGALDRVGFDLISFDLDGTLVDTAGEIAEAVNRTLHSHGIARRPVAHITRLIGAGLHELMRELYAKLLAEEAALVRHVPIDAMLTTLDAHYTDTTGTLARPYPGCEAALVDLKRAGLKLACVTNKEARHATRVLQATQLDGYFNLLIGGDSLPQKKPHASVLQHAARTLGVSLQRTAHVGDSAVDVAAARSAGVAAWAVPYGYNAGLPIEDARPDRVFDSLSAVAHHVLGPQRALPC